MLTFLSRSCSLHNSFFAFFVSCSLHIPPRNPRYLQTRLTCSWSLEGIIGCYVHFWDLDFEQLPKFYKVNFARSQLYAITLAVTKMSIIFFYQRIFDGPHVRRILWGTHFFNISLAIAYFIAQCFVSQPLYCEWTFDQGSECTYHDEFDGSGAYSALNAALDLWLVTFAAFLVWKLQMKAARRLSVIAVFGTGIL
jgi:hypothetical protein